MLDALAVHCPECAAPPLIECTRLSGDKRTRCHQQRWDAYRLQEHEQHQRRSRSQGHCGNCGQDQRDCTCSVEDFT